MKSINMPKLGEPMKYNGKRYTPDQVGYLAAFNANEAAWDKCVAIIKTVQTGKQH